MTVANIRQKLHHYIDKGDEKLLKLMYAFAREYNGDDDFEYEFGEEEIKLFEERRTKRLSGESKTYSSKEAKDMITGKKKPDVVKSFAREEEAWIDDKAYIAEMDRRFKDLETGKVKGLKLEDLATRARQAYKIRKRKKS